MIFSLLVTDISSERIHNHPENIVSQKEYKRGTFRTENDDVRHVHSEKCDVVYKDFF